jgi:WD40-like Beta Propeller Repeat
MSAQGSVPAAGAFALTLMMSGCWANVERTPAIEWSPDRSRVAFARDRLCPKGPCETLFIGPTTESAEALEGLADGTESTHEIAWSQDGRRVGFLVNGRQLRIYDAESRKPAGKVNLFADDPATADRIARGITFSDNGAAITFDDCPRDRSGCRAGMIGVR